MRSHNPTLNNAPQASTTIAITTIALLLTTQSATTHAANPYVFDNLTQFQNQTNAAATAALPNNDLAAQPFAVGDLSFSTPGQNLFVGTGNDTQWTTLNAGHDIAISGLEELNIDLATHVTAFGFEFVEPEAGVAGFVDSTFTVELFDGVTSVGTFTFQRPNDQLTHVAAASPAPFDRVQIRETTGAGENEYFGQFYTADTNTIFWDRSGSGEWVFGPNWSPIAVPTATDHVFITPNVNTTVTAPFLSSTSIAALTIDNTNPANTTTLNLSASGPFTIHGNVLVNPRGVINYNGGSITANGDNGTDGDPGTPGATGHTLESAGVLNINAAATTNLNGGNGGNSTNQFNPENGGDGGDGGTLILNDATTTISDTANVNLIGGNGGRGSGTFFDAPPGSGGHGGHGGNTVISAGTAALDGSATLTLNGGSGGQGASNAEGNLAAPGGPGGNGGTIILTDTTFSMADSSTLNLNGATGGQGGGEVGGARGGDGGNAGLITINGTSAGISGSATLNLNGGLGGLGGIDGSINFGGNGGDGGNAGTVSISDGTTTITDSTTLNLNGGDGRDGRGGVFFHNPGFGGDGGDGGTINVSGGTLNLTGGQINLLPGEPGAGGIGEFSNGIPGLPGNPGSINITGGTLNVTATLITGTATPTPSTDQINIIDASLTATGSPTINVNGDTTLQNANVDVSDTATFNLHPNADLTVQNASSLTLHGPRTIPATQTIHIDTGSFYNQNGPLTVQGNLNVSIATLDASQPNPPNDTPTTNAHDLTIDNGNFTLTGTADFNAPNGSNGSDANQGHDGGRGPQLLLDNGTLQLNFGALFIGNGGKGGRGGPSSSPTTGGGIGGDGGHATLINGATLDVTNATMNLNGGQGGKHSTASFAGGRSGGVGGQVTVTDGDLIVNNATLNLTGGNSSTGHRPQRAGNGGTITITNGTADVLNATVNIQGGDGEGGGDGGQGGQVVVDNGNFTLDNSTLNLAGGRAFSSFPLTASTTTDDTSTALLSDQLIGDTLRGGKGGNLTVNGGSATLSGGATINLAGGFGVDFDGQPGSVTVTGGTLTLNAATITTDNTASPAPTPNNIIATPTTVSGTGELSITEDITIAGASITLDPTATLDASTITTTLNNTTTLNINTASATFDTLNIRDNATVTNNAGNLTAHTAVNIQAGTITGALAGAAELYKGTPDPATLAGTDPNTYTGQTTVSNGTLNLSKDPNVNAIGGDLGIGNGTLKLNNPHQIPDSAAVILNAPGTFDLNDHPETIGSLHGDGNIQLGPSNFNPLAPGAGHFTGNVFGKGDIAPAPGAHFTFGGTTDPTSTAGFIVSNSTLHLDNALIQNIAGDVLVGNLGTLTGTATTAASVDVQNGGTFSPGNSPGVFDINEDLTVAPFATLNIDAVATDTPIPGTTHDRINVTGNVTLDGTLNVTPLPTAGPIEDTPVGNNYLAITYGTRTPNSFFHTINGTLINTAFALAPILDDTAHTFTLRASIPGDLNLDNKVSVADLSFFALNFGSTPGLHNETDNQSSWRYGDFNTDGQITVADLSLLALNFGFELLPDGSTTPPTPLSLYTAASIAGIDPTTIPGIPEPTTLYTLMTAVILTNTRINRHKKR